MEERNGMDGTASYGKRGDGAFVLLGQAIGKDMEPEPLLVRRGKNHARERGEQPGQVAMVRREGDMDSVGIQRASNSVFGFDQILNSSIR